MTQGVPGDAVGDEPETPDIDVDFHGVDANGLGHILRDHTMNSGRRLLRIELHDALRHVLQGHVEQM